MKFNYVKSLVVSLGIALLFTGFNSYAYFTQSPSYVCNGFPNCTINLNGYWRFETSNVTSSSSTDNYYYFTIPCIGSNNCYANNGNRYYNSSADSSNYMLRSHNPGEYIQYKTKTSSSSEGKYNSFAYNFVKITADGEGYNYSWWSEDNNSYNSKRILANGYINSSLPDERFIYYTPRNGSFVFYNQDYITGFHTIQFIGNYELVDRFLYVDPAESTNDNVYFVDSVNKLAYSTRVDDPDLISDLLFGKYVLDDSFFNTFGWDRWYDISFGGNRFFPNTAGNFLMSDSPVRLANNMAGYKSSSYANIGIIYNVRYDEVVQPNYGSNGGSNINSGSSMTNSNLSGYYLCLTDYQRIKSFSDALYQCRSNFSVMCLPTDTNCYSKSDYDDLVAYMRSFTGTYYDTGFTGRAINFPSCSDVIYPAFVKFYITTPLNSNNTVNTDDFEKALYWSISPNSVTSDAVCGSYPDNSSEQSWTCKYLGIGCNDFDTLGYGYDHLKSIISPFWDETVGELVRSFDSGYNYLNISSCSSDYYGKSYGWANTVFIVLVAFLIFQLYQLFKS